MEIAEDRCEKRNYDYHRGDRPKTRADDLGAAEHVHYHTDIRRQVRLLLTQHRVNGKADKLRVQHIGSGHAERYDYTSQKKQL